MVAKRASRKNALPIVILSGGTGRTALQVLDSALAQFTTANVETIVKARVRSTKAALKVVDFTEAKQAILCHTLVDPQVRELVLRECHLRNIDAVDLLGPIVTLLDDHLDGTPRNKPGLSYELNREQFERIEAVDFTLAHDDGARLKGLKQADVVIVGPSRVSKSVTCFYLAYRGIRAANVPLIPGSEPPTQLIQIDPNRVVALMMNPHRLQNIREARRGAIRAAQLREYANLRSIAKELREAQAMIDQYGWQSIDVSYMAVEEVASEIIHAKVPRAA